MEVFSFFVVESVPELESFEVPVNETSSHISTPGTETVEKVQLLTSTATVASKDLKMGILVGN